MAARKASAKKTSKTKTKTTQRANKTVTAKKPAAKKSAKPARKRLTRATVPLVVAGSGVGGVNSFNYANIQHQEAKQIRKALLPFFPDAQHGVNVTRYDGNLDIKTDGESAVAGQKVAETLEAARRAFAA